LEDNDNNSFLVFESIKKKVKLHYILSAEPFNEKKVTIGDG
jgi:hypothetical protein